MVNAELFMPLMNLLPASLAIVAVYLYPPDGSDPEKIITFTKKSGRNRQEVTADLFNIGFIRQDPKYGVRVPDGAEGGYTDENVDPVVYNFVIDERRGDPTHAVIFQNFREITTLNAINDRITLPGGTLVVYKWEGQPHGRVF